MEQVSRGICCCQQRKPRLVAHCVGSRGPVALEDGGVGVGGHLTSRCWQWGTRTGGISQMGLRPLALASHRRCWVQPGTDGAVVPRGRHRAQ